MTTTPQRSKGPEKKESSSPKATMKMSKRKASSRRGDTTMPQFMRWRPCYLLLFVLLLVRGTIFYAEATATSAAAIDDNDDPSCSAEDGADDESCQATATITEEEEESGPTIPSTMPSSVEIQMMAERFGVDPLQKIVCEDKNESCQGWANSGLCKKNPALMNVECRRSCELCAGQKKINPMLKLMELSQAADMGVVQELEDELWPKVTAEMVSQHITKTREYLQEFEKINPDVKKICLNANPLCTIWAVSGECEKNIKFMQKSCAPVCRSCKYLSVEGRCPVDDDPALQIWKPGDLNKMFERLTKEPYLSKYDVEIISSPSDDDDDDAPWVITLENVITEEEAEKLIELGAVEGYTRSSDVGKRRADGKHESNISTGRTSTNSWCLNECYKDPSVQDVIQRLSNITGIPEPNSEYLQLLRYEKEQFYKVHHDYVPFHLKRQQGVRILTMYLYLNDVEAGGGTNFDKLDITVLPKRGRTLLWPSVLNEKPNSMDPRTSHQALPVEAGIKYGANAWFHMRDFKTPHNNTCA